MVVVAAAPSFVLVILAAAALLLAYAFGRLIAEPLANVLRNVPVVGGDIARALLDLAQWVQRSAQDAMGSALDGLTDLVDLGSGAVQALLGAITGTAEWLGGRLGELWQGAFSAIELLGDQVLGLVRTAAALAKDVERALTRAVAVAVDVARVIERTIPNAIANAVGAVQDWVRGRVDDVRRAILAIVSEVTDDILRRLGIERTARAAADAALRGDTQAWLDDLARRLGADVNTLQRELGRAIDGLDIDLTGLRELIGPVVAGTVVGMITKVATDVTTMYRQCVKPGCDYLGPQLDSLAGIQDAAVLAAVLAWMAHAAQHPQDAAGDTVDMVEGLMGQVRGLVGPIIPVGF